MIDRFSSFNVYFYSQSTQCLLAVSLFTVLKSKFLICSPQKLQLKSKKIVSLLLKDTGAFESSKNTLGGQI